MADIRIGGGSLPSPLQTPSTAPTARSDAARAAQRAFFDAARQTAAASPTQPVLKPAAATPAVKTATVQPAAARAAVQAPAPTSTASARDAASAAPRLAPPGSRLNIVV